MPVNSPIPLRPLVRFSNILAGNPHKASRTNAMEGDTGATADRAKLQTLFARLLPGNLKTIWQDVAQTLGPVLIVSAIVIFSALHFVRPAPPSTLTLASGAPGTKFNLVAHQYQKILARNGITLNIIATEGSVDNLNRMLAAGRRVDIALACRGHQRTDIARKHVLRAAHHFLPQPDGNGQVVAADRPANRDRTT